MTRKNRYVHRAHISGTQFRDLVRLFALDLEATKVAVLTGLNRNTVNRYFQAIRQRIARVCEQTAPWRGTVEVDEAYFGPRRVKGKRGRGAGSKTVVFGIFKRNGHVSTRRSSPMQASARCKPLCEATSIAAVSFIRMAGAGMMAWSIWAIASIVGSCTARTSLLGDAVFISTALKASGERRKRGWPSDVVSGRICSLCI